jgi:hypothetical protein
MVFVWTCHRVGKGARKARASFLKKEAKNFYPFGCAVASRIGG